MTQVIHCCYIYIYRSDFTFKMWKYGPEKLVVWLKNAVVTLVHNKKCVFTTKSKLTNAFSCCVNSQGEYQSSWWKKYDCAYAEHLWAEKAESSCCVMFTGSTRSPPAWLRLKLSRCPAEFSSNQLQHTSLEVSSTPKNLISWIRCG